MLNPDGVIKGNYRFSGYGCDLNRKWRNCKPNQQPEVYLMREFLRTLKEEKKVRMYIDMHGHSRKKNVFFYGCCEKGDTVNVKPRAFPYLMSKIYEAFKY
jgi:murein tripeptide amidase MpaA